MSSPRLPRFSRVVLTHPIRITDRDREIIRLVHRHRFLRSSHFTSLVKGSKQQIVRRLQLLFHHGFLTRPRAQLQYFGRGGSHEIVYGLGNKGARMLENEGVQLKHLRLNEKNDGVGKIFLEHALLVSSIMVAVELAAKATGSVAVVHGDALKHIRPGGRPASFSWRVTTQSGDRLGLIPDRVFALTRNEQSGGSGRSYFFFEADRGTMPVFRENLLQTSFFRKLLAYEATWKTGLHEELFGFRRIRVLVVTTSPSRMASLINACSKLKSGHGLFLFCDQLTLECHGNIFKAPWKNGRGDTTSLSTNVED